MDRVIYARQSVEKKNSLSIDGQIKLCENAAGQPLKVYQDRGYSGKNTDRPAFLQLMKDVQAGKINQIFVYRLDRFSRSVADFSHLWETLQDNHVEFVSVNENFDTATPMGRAMLHIIMVFAQLERETTAERVRDNYYRRASLGAWPGGPAPFGFSIGRFNNRDSKSIPTLIANEYSTVVLRIFEAYLSEGASLGSVAKALNQENIAAPRRSTWDNVSLSRILHNPVYVMADDQVYLYLKAMGIQVTSLKQEFDGAHGVLLVGKKKAAVKTAAMLNSLGFVPSELWLGCQNKLQQNQQIGNSGKGTHTWLSGLLKCAKCGYSLKVVQDHSKRYLICSGRYNLSQCDADISLNLTELELVTEKEIETLLAECPPEPVQDPKADCFTQQLEELDCKADRLMDAFSTCRDLPSAYLHRALLRLEEERHTLLEAQRRHAHRQSPQEYLQFVKLDFNQKKFLATQFIRRIDVTDDSAEIFWNV